MDSESLMKEVKAAFAGLRRPERFTDRDHCCECAEHDDTLRAHDPDSITLEELGNPGWDPMCFALPEAFLYYFPALVRLALDESGEDSYLEQFLFHLGPGVNEERFFPHFSPEQRRVVLTTLRHLDETVRAEPGESVLANDMAQTLKTWSRPRA